MMSCESCNLKSHEQQARVEVPSQQHAAVAMALTLWRPPSAAAPASWGHYLWREAACQSRLFGLSFMRRASGGHAAEAAKGHAPPSSARVGQGPAHLRKRCRSRGPFRPLTAPSQIPADFGILFLVHQRYRVELMGKAAAEELVHMHTPPSWARRQIRYSRLGSPLDAEYALQRVQNRPSWVAASPCASTPLSRCRRSGSPIMPNSEARCALSSEHQMLRTA